MKSVFLLVLLLPVSALAEGATPLERAFAGKFQAVVNSDLVCSADLISARDELAKANARIKELEEKLPKDKK